MDVIARTTLTALVILLAAASTGCGREGAPPVAEPAAAAVEAPPEWAVERARGAADALTAELAGKLMEELKRGGPKTAIAVCSEVAPEIAAAHSRDGVAVRRVSLRVRNPADFPDVFERRHLEALEERLRAGEAVSEVIEVVDESGARELRYLRPILVSDVCLKCHGDPEALAPEVRQLLAERYPGDEALGYEPGDLRGAVSVRVSLEGAGP